jgi:cation diffusion facilitator CzcD-associated flavoprotein CzcO
VSESFIQSHLLTLYSGTLHPRHIVQATGLNGEIRMPQIPGMESFEDKITHSTGFVDASPKYAGRKVIVVGTGTSGHDIAQCCQKHGADVTIIQRSPTFIVSLDTVQKTVAPRYNNRTVSSP